MEEHKDKFKDLMSLSKLEVPFDDFDAKLLARIDQIEAEKASISRTRKYALISFVFGIIFGIGLNYLISEILAENITNSSIKTYLTIFSQMIYILLFILLIDKVLKLRQMKKQAEI